MELARAPPDPTLKVEKIKELKELLDAGALTQEEFDAEKKMILAGGAAVTVIQPVAAQPHDATNMTQMQAMQMQLQMSRDPSAPFHGRIETEEIKGCACHVCPAPPFAWYAIGCIEPKGPDTIGGCWFVSVCTWLPWWPDCPTLPRQPGTNTFGHGSTKYHVTKTASGKIAITEDNPCVWGNHYYELC
jgi:hypothetical protein